MTLPLTSAHARRSVCIAWTAAAALASPLRAQIVTADSTAPTVFRNVRVFDGERVLPVATVVIDGDRITRVAVGGEPVAAGPQANVVDGAGRTLLPGFIDAHTHTFSRAYAKNATGWGVTTQLDMFTSLEVMRALADEQRAGGARDRSDLLSAGVLVTAAGGHGTQYGFPIPTLDRPEDAQAFVDARIAEGSDYIKIVLEDGSAFGMQLPTLDESRVQAAAEAAHARGKLAVVHVGDHDAADLAIAAGADGIVHIFADRPPDEGFARAAAAAKVFVVPTLAVIEGTARVPGDAALVADPRVNRRLTPSEITNLQASFPKRPGSSASIDHAVSAVRSLHAAGVRILAGSDAPNPGTIHGASLHRELELLVSAGLTAVEALAAATSAAADAFGLADRGRVAEGLRADVVLVDGDPTTDILDTRNVVGIWKEGRRWKLELALIFTISQRAQRGIPVGPPGAVPPEEILGDFEDDYGNTFTITPGSWEVHGSERYSVLRWDAQAGFVILKDGDPTQAGLWTRIDWMPLDGVESWRWAFCMSAYDQPTPEAAVTGSVADRRQPREGCNGLPFSRMRRVEG